MSGRRTKASWRWGVAWLLLSLAFAMHVADEAFNDFLAVYNPIAADVRERWPLLALPTFTFGVWITQLFLALTALFMLTPSCVPGQALDAAALLCLRDRYARQWLHACGWFDLFRPGASGTVFIALADCCSAFLADCRR